MLLLQLHVRARILLRTLFANFGFSLFRQPVLGMATSINKKVLILGHSFIQRLVTNLWRECVDHAVETFNVSGVNVWLNGVGGWTVQKLRDYDLHQTAKCKPDILVLEIGANDLTELAPEVVGAVIEDLVCLLHETYGVEVMRYLQEFIVRFSPSDLIVKLIYLISGLFWSPWILLSFLDSVCKVRWKRFF